MISTQFLNFLLILLLNVLLKFLDYQVLNCYFLESPKITTEKHKAEYLTSRKAQNNSFLLFCQLTFILTDS